ncbi:MAG: DNA polymerase III subunit delta [Clostridia bacterium]|nr:DNA polymerase III subunit delta [Clostridia bacterium]
MKYTDFKNGLDNGQTFSIYLFEGEDVFFSERGITLLKDKFLIEPSLNLAEFNGAETEISQITDSLMSYPFMADKRLTVVREFYPKKEDEIILKEFLDNPAPDMLFIIANSRSCELFKRYPSVAVVDCAKADLSLIARWVKGECASNGIVIDLESARLIGEYCQQDMLRVQIETKKLCAYVLDKGEITLNDVVEMVNRDVEYKIYEMTDYIGRKNFDKALSVISEMLSKGEPSQKILTSVYNYFRRLLHVAISDLSETDLAKELGVKDFAVRKMKTQSGYFRKKSLKSAVDSLVDADYRFKSGLSNADEEMWLTIFKIMTE